MRALLAGLVMLASVLACTTSADDSKLRLITWADYAPADVIALFKQETGIQVQVTLSNNEEMISKLRATGGAGYDLAQPSQDRITGVQREFGIYRPFDLKPGEDRAVPARHAGDHPPRTPLSTASSTVCRICGAPKDWSSTPSARA
jgi:ABC-type glycerol-3-phosphate transport system substrate-binding protein